MRIPYEERPPTARQLVVLYAVQEAIWRDGFSPTIRELAAAVGVASTNTISDHLKALERKGFVRLSGSRSSLGGCVARGIVLLKAPPGPAPKRAPYCGSGRGVFLPVLSVDGEPDFVADQQTWTEEVAC